jgi:hypothetical protein
VCQRQQFRRARPCGSQFTFPNLSEDATFALRANGAVMHTVFDADGSETVTASAQRADPVLTDVPAGPSTTRHVGRVAFTIDDDGVFTLVSTSGTTTDICAALS